MYGGGMTNVVKDSVAICYISGGQVEHEFSESLLSTMLQYQKRNPIRAHVTMQSSPRIAQSRCDVVNMFIDETDAEWLFFVDTDMVWKGKQFAKLYDAARNRGPCVMGALCFTGRPGNEIKPTIYKLVQDETGNTIDFQIVFDFPRDEIIQVGATGAACILIHRDIVEAMREKFGKLPNGRHNPQPYFTESVMSGNSVGEDIAFCIRTNALGYPIYVDTRTVFGHKKSWILDLETFELDQASRSESLKLPEMVDT